MTENDLVNHPNHYGGKDNPYEAIKVIENWKLNFNLGNAIKYLARADHHNHNHYNDHHDNHDYYDYHNYHDYYDYNDYNDHNDHHNHNSQKTTETNLHDILRFTKNSYYTLEVLARQLLSVEPRLLFVPVRMMSTIHNHTIPEQSPSNG